MDKRNGPESKINPGAKGGSAAANRPCSPFSLHRDCPARSSPSRVRFAASRPELLAGRTWGWAVYEGKGGNRQGWTLHKRAITQRSERGLFFKGLGVAKRYCTIDSIGDSFVQTA